MQIPINSNLNIYNEEIQPDHQKNLHGYHMEVKKIGLGL